MLYPRDHDGSKSTHLGYTHSLRIIIISYNIRIYINTPIQHRLKDKRNGIYIYYLLKSR